jgi:hypothetical protein
VVAEYRPIRSSRYFWVILALKLRYLATNGSRFSDWPLVLCFVELQQTTRRFLSNPQTSGRRPLGWQGCWEVQQAVSPDVTVGIHKIRDEESSGGWTGRSRVPAHVELTVLLGVLAPVEIPRNHLGSGSILCRTSRHLVLSAMLNCNKQPRRFCSNPQTSCWRGCFEVGSARCLTAGRESSDGWTGSAEHRPIWSSRCFWKTVSLHGGDGLDGDYLNKGWCGPSSRCA